MKNILLVAAENSAENYAIQIIDESIKQKTGFHFFGIGGNKLKRKGMEILIQNEDLSLIGIVEILGHLFRIKKIMNYLMNQAKQRADAALLIDFPDFNLRLAKKLSKVGIPVYYYISPTIWAWRYRRIKLLKKYIRHIFLVYPFEIPIFQKEAIPFTYTGHPVIPDININRSKEEIRKFLKVNDSEKIITLLPGSRRVEIENILPAMLSAVTLLSRHFSLIIFIVKADNIDKKLLSTQIKGASIPIHIFNQRNRFNLIQASDAILSTHGSANLEIALLGVPFVAVYKLNNLTYILGKPLLKIKQYSIVNILAQKEVIPELIQHRCRADLMAKELENILENEKRRQAMIEEFAKIKIQLKQDQFPAQIIVSKLNKDL